MADEYIVTGTKCKVSGGVFTADVEWTLFVDSIEPLRADMLADKIVERFYSVLPVEGTGYPDRPYVTCRSFECERIKGRVYSFKAQYSDANTAEAEEPQENPLLEPPKIKPTAGMITEALYQDRDGNAFLNTAGDPIIDQVSLNIAGFRIQHNVASVPASWTALANTTNNAPITVLGQTLPTNSVRFIVPNDWLSDVKWKNGIPYYVFTFELDVDLRNLHYGVKLNAGVRQLVEGVRKAIKNKDGSEISEPVPLNEDGTVMDDPTPETVLVRKNKRLPEANYSILPGVF